MYVGFNASKASEMIDSIVDGYNSLGNKIGQAWLPVRQELLSQWVGPDEQDFEKKFVEKINNLYLATYNLADNCTKSIAGAVDGWVEYQRKNTIDGSEAADDPSLAGIIAKIKEFLFGSRLVKKDSILVFMPTAIDGDRGLKNSDSASKIKTAVDDYVKQVKTACNSLFANTNVNSAFFGEEQRKAIAGYVVSVENAIAEVMIAVKDFYDKLDSLAGSNYGSAQSQVSQSFDTSKTSIESSVSDLGNSRWV